MPRINFVSFTFLFAFGLGSFAGIAMALFAVALARPADETTIVQPTAMAVVATPTLIPTATLTPTATPTPIPVIRTLATLQVHIGPDDDYAILGTLASGSEVEVRGRDSNGDWLAIDFPPGSAARGWIPSEQVEGLALFQVLQLDVLQASLIDTTPSFPSATDTPTVFEGNDGFPTATPEDASPTPDTEVDATEVDATPTVTPFSTPTAPSLDYGPTDLSLRSVTVNSDGTLRVIVDNLGPGDVPAVSVVVTINGFPPELLTSGLLRGGQATTMRTTTALTQSANVSITVDPNGSLTDANRANNTRSYALSP